MIDVNRHKFFLVQILKDIYSDLELSNCLGFKGGTALMFFYDLPRFSVDLDFNLIDITKEDSVYAKVRNIVLKHGTIFDEAKKFYGPLIVLDYGFGERKLKVEISNRQSGDRYEIKNLLGINIRVMVAEDMFAHKLCALLDRETVTARDVFDNWFFMQKHIPVNSSIVEYLMNMPFPEYIERCIRKLESLNNKELLMGLGELTDNKMKNFVRNRLKEDTIILLRFYKDYPIVR